MSSLRTPLYDWHLSKKARMVPFGGWEMPVQYTGIIEEHQAVRTHAGLFDISHMGRLSFSGKDVLLLIQKVFTNDAAKMKDGQVRYGLVCNERGGILDDILVYRWAAGWSMIVNASNRSKIVAWLNEHKAGLDVQVLDQTLETALVAVQGPKAIELCQDLFSDPVQGLAYYYATPTTYHGQPCQVSRTGYTGEDGIEIAVANAQIVELVDELVQKGCKPGGLGCRDTLRLEAAMPLYGHELNETIDPLQAGLAWAVKFDKGDFLGRDAILKRKETKRAQRIGLKLEGKRAAREGCPIMVGDRSVGTVTSGSFVPYLNQSIAMAYVDPEHTPLGTALNVDIRGTITPANVVAIPFYKRAK